MSDRRSDVEVAAAVGKDHQPIFILERFIKKVFKNSFVYKINFLSIEFNFAVIATNIFADGLKEKEERNMAAAMRNMRNTIMSAKQSNQQKFEDLQLYAK